MTTNHYGTLGIPPDATAKEIKRAYRKRAQESHPDRDGGDEETFHAIAKAYNVLADPHARKRYDETGEDEQKGPSLQEMAASSLEGLFDTLITNEVFKGNFVEQVTAEVNSGITGAKAEHLRATRIHARIDKLSGRIRSIGDNVFQNAINKKLKAIEVALENLEQQQQVLDIMRSMLDGYTDEVPEKQPAPQDRWANIARHQ